MAPRSPRRKPGVSTPWTARAPILGALGAAAIGLGGCVASIHEERVYGLPHPAIDAQTQVVAVRGPGVSRVQATARGRSVDVSVEEVAECREESVTAPMIRDVELRRTFADDAQERNGALAMLAGGAIGLLAYGAHQANCSAGDQACTDVTSTTRTLGYATLALAAIPVAMLAYNAIVVQSRYTIDRAAPVTRATPWIPCPTQRVPHEEVEVTVGGRTLRGVTGPDGRVALDLATVPGDDVAHASGAIVHHAGSPDVTLNLISPTMAPPASTSPPSPGSKTP
ncbi:MAG: hypothetical protein ABSF69_06065 [Polyangiaceae bacterium]|jgi:hypothetical protein